MPIFTLKSGKTLWINPPGIGKEDAEEIVFKMKELFGKKRKCSFR